MANPQDIYRFSGLASSKPNSGDLPVSVVETITIDINISAITAGSITFTWSRKGDDGIYYPVKSTTALAAPGSTSIDIGPGMSTAASPGHTGQLSWVVVTGPVTFTATVQGK